MSFVLLLCANLIPVADDKPREVTPSTVRKELAALQEEFDAKWKVFMGDFRKAKTPQERLDAMQKNPARTYAEKFLALAEKNAGDPAVIAVAVAVCRLDRGGKPDSPRNKVLELVRERH